MRADAVVLRAIQRAPMQTMTLAQVESVSESANTWRVLERLVDDKLVLRIARGVYMAPPLGRSERWEPDLDVRALAWATARYGEAALMGVGAVRALGVYPRALGVAVVAVPRKARPELSVAGGRVVLVERDMDTVDVTTFMTPVGRGVVTSLSQTWYDLVSRPYDGGVPRTVAEVRAALDRVVSIEEKRKLVASKKRVPLSVKQGISIAA